MAYVLSAVPTAGAAFLVIVSPSTLRRAAADLLQHSLQLVRNSQDPTEAAGSCAEDPSQSGVTQ